MLRPKRGGTSCSSAANARSAAISTWGAARHANYRSDSDQRGCNGKPLYQPSRLPHEYGPGSRPTAGAGKKLVLRDPVGWLSSTETLKCLLSGRESADGGRSLLLGPTIKVLHQSLLSLCHSSCGQKMVGDACGAVAHTLTRSRLAAFNKRWRPT